MSSKSTTPDHSEADLSRIIEMAWEDRTPFDAIEAAYAISEATVIAIMRRNLKRSSFELWRKRVAGRSTKHTARCDTEVLRHRANNRRPK
jgi:uncharacterized protein (TIGR03643 family)